MWWNYCESLVCACWVLAEEILGALLRLVVPNTTVLIRSPFPSDLVFVLTLSNGDRFYGYCRRVFPTPTYSTSTKPYIDMLHNGRRRPPVPPAENNTRCLMIISSRGGSGAFFFPILKTIDALSCQISVELSKSTADTGKLEANEAQPWRARRLRFRRGPRRRF